MNDIIGKKFNILEKRILLVMEAWEKNKKEKENLLKELSICKEKLEIKLKKEQEHLKRRIDFLKKEREEIKSRIKKLLEAISIEDSTTYQPDNIE